MQAAVLAFVLLTAPIPPKKLALLPRTWPDERLALQQRLEQGEPLKKLIDERGVAPRVLNLIEKTAPGPLMNERYARRLVYLVPGLTHSQRALFDTLVPGADGAQLALLAVDRKEGVRHVERRFWLAAYYALTAEQRRALRKLYPESHYGLNNILGHIYRLPKLTATQANRIRALATEHGSESVADVAEAQRLQARIEKGEQQLVQELRVIQLRQAKRTRAAYARGRAVLTAEQNAALDALVPFVDPGALSRHPGEIVKTMNPTPAQQPRLQALGKGLERVAQEVRERIRKKQREMDGEVGAESPQAAMMQMMHMGGQAQLAQAFHAAAHEALLTILTPEQVLRWIAGG
ncbi:MAG: Spy/CpxP family protein refolding chaperone [Planctomycetota bacterium]|jgi:hypothetical protein